MSVNCYHLLMDARRIRESPRGFPDRPRSRDNSHAGFVLTGGRSSRLGQDKALLPWEGATLVEYVAACVGAAASSATLVGAPERYGHLGLTVIADRYQACGPLGGICTALEITSADWNLIVACDMPGVTAEFLSGLLGAAEDAGADCLIPESNGLHPLCAVYHRRVGAVAKRQILGKSLKMHDFIANLQAITYPSAKAFVENINTPQDWTSR